MVVPWLINIGSYYRPLPVRGRPLSTYPIGPYPFSLVDKTLSLGSSPLIACSVSRLWQTGKRGRQRSCPRIGIYALDIGPYLNAGLYPLGLGPGPLGIDPNPLSIDPNPLSIDAYPLGIGP